MRKTITETTELTIYLCDVCDHKAEITARSCMGCDKDLCIDCRSWLDHDPWTGEFLEGSLPICDACSSTLDIVRFVIDDIRSEADVLIDKIRVDFFVECRKDNG